MEIRNFEKFRKWYKEHSNVKNAIVRCDLNIPSDIEDLSRIIAIKDTVRTLIDLGLKVILISHYKRPSPEEFFTEKFSLQSIAGKIEKIMGVAADFIPNSISEITKNDIKSQITVLENLRFYPGEKANDQTFARELAKFADVYINDAFSVSHRAHASVDAITRFLPSFSGIAFDREIAGISKATSNILRPYTAIIGGSKISSKIDVLKEISQKADILIIAGAMANTFLSAQGYKLGFSLIERDFFDTSLEIIKNSKSKIILPSDFVIAENITSPGVPCALANINAKMSCFDIGPNTIRDIKNISERSKTILWNGALGAFEFSNFDTSSKEVSAHIAKMTQQNGLISVIGGGETVASIGNFKEQMTFVSTAGGAFLEYVSGYDLPGVLALSEIE